MSAFRRCLLCLTIVTLMITAAGQAQTIVTPVDPNAPPPPNFDGRCAINFVDLNGWGWAMVDYLCTGTFSGRVEVDLEVEYTAAGFSLSSPAPAGYVSAGYQA